MEVKNNRDDVDLSELLEVKLTNDDNFLKVKETLTRLGVANYKTKTLYQSCHILQKRGKYYIVHFKEMFKLDGKMSTLSEEDIARRNSIALCLEDWNLIDIVSPFEDAILLDEVDGKVQGLKILSHKDKNQWNLESKYTIGNSGKKKNTSSTI